MNCKREDKYCQRGDKILKEEIIKLQSARVLCMALYRNNNLENTAVQQLGNMDVY